MNGVVVGGGFFFFDFVWVVFSKMGESSYDRSINQRNGFVSAMGFQTQQRAGGTFACPPFSLFEKSSWFFSNVSFSSMMLLLLLRFPFFSGNFRNDIQFIHV